MIQAIIPVLLISSFSLAKYNEMLSRCSPLERGNTIQSVSVQFDDANRNAMVVLVSDDGLIDLNETLVTPTGKYSDFILSNDKGVTVGKFDQHRIQGDDGEFVEAAGVLLYENKTYSCDLAQ